MIRRVTPPEDSFGAMLRQRRKRSGMTLRDLAYLLTWSPSKLSAVEVGRRPPLDDHNIEFVAKILHCDRVPLLAAAYKERGSGE